MAREQMSKDDDASLGGQATFTGGAKRETDPQSLGDQPTFAGANHGHAPQSLGDEVTRGGIDAGDDVAFDDDMELVDLSARYSIEGTLGQGGMGEVLLATDQRLKRKVAIKRVQGDKVRSRTALQRFLTEAQSVAAINHPNIVQIYDYGRDKSGPFLILEFVDGGSLLDRCRDGALPLEEAIKLTCQLCDGLAMAHAANIIHRDVKPANVLLTKSGLPKLTDFGLAKDESADASHTLTGAVLGTLDFMPPEQRKDVALTDARSDLWSLAATLYQLVTGKTPKIIRLNTLPASLQGVLGQALEDHPGDRFQTAAEFRAALQACLQDSGSRSVSAPSAAVDLEAGTCLACGTKNDLHRKFCRQCAASLRLSCLSCERELPIWDNICGQCGANQERLVAARRSELDAQRAEAESWRSQYEFEKARKIAGEISVVTDSRLQHLKEWSESFLSATESEQKRQEESAIRHFGEAQSHRAAFDYPSAIHTMQSIPGVMRTSEMQSYLQALQSDHQEVTNLIESISNRVKRRDLEGLLESVSRAVELRGDRADLRTLLTQLTQRQEKLIRQRDEAYHQSKRLLDQGRAKEALELVHTVKATDLRRTDLELKRRLEQAVQAEEELAALLKAAKADNVLEPEEVLALLAGAEKCLRRNPHHEKISALREKWIQRIQRTPEAYSDQLWASLPKSVLRTLPPSILAELPQNVLAGLPSDVLATLPSDVLAELPDIVLQDLPIEVVRKDNAYGEGTKSSGSNRRLLIGLSAGGGALVIALLTWMLWPDAPATPPASVVTGDARQSTDGFTLAGIGMGQLFYSALLLLIICTPVILCVKDAHSWTDAEEAIKASIILSLIIDPIPIFLYVRAYYPYLELADLVNFMLR